MLPYNDFAANGNNPLNSVSQLKGALHHSPLPHHLDMRVRIRRFSGVTLGYRRVEED